VHGEYRQLKFHADLAQHAGIPVDRINIMEDGDCLQVTPSGARLGAKLSIGRRFIDEEMAEEVHDTVMRDRRFLSEDGFVVAQVKLDRATGQIHAPVEIITRGFLHADDSSALFEESRALIRDLVASTPIEEKQDESLFKELLRKTLKKFFYKQTQKRPIILPVILEG
jgi:ribonuclease J